MKGFIFMSASMSFNEHTSSVWNSRAGIRIVAPIATLATITILDIVWATFTGYHFAGMFPSLCGIMVLAFLSLVYGKSGRSAALADMAYFGLLWIVFTIAGAVATYLAAAMDYPLIDTQLQRIDEALYFDWMAFYDFFSGMPLLSAILMFAYFSIFPQVILSIIYFSCTGNVNRNLEMWWTSLLALGVTTVLSGIYPALGTLQHYGIALDKAVHLPHYYQLRAGEIFNFNVPDMQGIITFPSYHVVLALVLMYVYRQTKLAYVVIPLNVLMLVATPIYGGHYLADLIGGAVIAICAILVVRRAIQQPQSNLQVPNVTTKPNDMWQRGG
jgi:membrane-associated phospholipid phosphatase